LARDWQFEMEYLLNLTLLILGFLTVPIISNYINITLAFIFLLLVSFHVILFNLAYIFKMMSDFETTRVIKLEKLSKGTLISVMISFSYIIFYIIINSILSSFILIKFWVCFISLILPAFIIAVIFIPLFKLYQLLSIFKKIKVIFAPKDEIEIFSNFEDTERLFLKIENKTSQKQTFKVQISPPEQVIYSYREKEGKKLEEEISIDTKRQKIFHIFFKYIGDQQRYDEFIEIIIKHDKGSFNRKIGAMLNPT